MCRRWIGRNSYPFVTSSRSMTACSGSVVSSSPNPFFRCAYRDDEGEVRFGLVDAEGGPLQTRTGARKALLLISSRRNKRILNYSKEQADERTQNSVYHHIPMNYTLSKDGFFAWADGARFPAIGYGTFQLRGVEETAQAVREAASAGYRLIDTAADYGNEEGVGEGVRTSNVPRSDILVSSKVWPADLGYDKTMRAFEGTLGRLGLDYLDIYLIHWPCSDELNISTWKAFEELHEQRLVRTIGLSNFSVGMLKPLLASARIPPRLNQLEFHPYHYDPGLLQFCSEHEILVEAWSPLIQGSAFSDEVLQRIASAHSRTAAQIALRWSVQMGAVPLPKTSSPSRMTENIAIFDFELSKDEMDAISGLNAGRRLGPDPESYHFCK